ncbi:MAG: 16S rRNA pseudouridine(516) synthase [Clostridia bacterium]|nr:16S rRNA pseudouridine(516) synthase [Clostridia bacterium]
MRLDKYLCDTLNFTRSEAKKIIGSGRVTVGGKTVKSSSLHIENEEVCLDGQPVAYQQYFYIMLHKPQGYICANRDQSNRTVFDLLPKEYQKKDLFVCGRLDKDTTGLVLLTNNGAVAHRLLAPKKEIFKEYLVGLRDKVSTKDIALLKEGIVLRDGLHCKPAYFEPLGERNGIIRISEGKYHQIKRMFAALGNEVVALHRRSIHGLTLDENLAVGECRYLTEQEINALVAVE